MYSNGSGLISGHSYGLDRTSPVLKWSFGAQVVATNDEPVISGPDEYSGVENTWFSLNELGVGDVDATDRLTRNETVGAMRCLLFVQQPCLFLSL